MYEQKSNNIDLTRGNKKYDAAIKNINGIIEKISPLFDITEYKIKLNDIQNRIQNEDALKNKMLTNYMQLDYEDMIYDNYIKEIENLTKEIEEKYKSFYELYLLNAKINSQINNINGENISEILKDTINLINLVNNLNTHDIKEKKVLISEAYQTIYNILLYEEIFEREDILSYINYLNIPANKENIGRLLAKDIKTIDENELIMEDLRTIKTEGLGYDYLNSNIIKKISRNTVGESNSEYQERKKEAINDISMKIKNLTFIKNDELEKLKNNNNKIKKYKLTKVLLSAKILSLFLIPIITFSAGKGIGKTASNNITEYKTITRTIDLNTGSLIDSPEEVFDEHSTTYVATIIEYTPWRENQVGGGYIRNAIAYEYIVPDNISEDYHITSSDIENNIREKYRFVESKETLSELDSTTDNQIIVTETYQDKSVSRKSTKFIIPGELIGTTIGLAISTALVFLKIIGIDKTNEIFNGLNDEIKKYKLSNKEIQERLKVLKDEAINLEKEYNETVKKYGNIANNFIFDDIDTSWIINYKKKKKN